MKLLKEITTVYSGNKSTPILLDVQTIKLFVVRACGTHNNHYNVKNMQSTTPGWEPMPLS